MIKVRLHTGGNLNTRKSYFTRYSSGIVKSSGEYKLPARFLSALLISGLLMPLLFLGQARIVAAQTAPIINQLPATASDPAVPFVYNSPDSSSLSGSLMNATLSTAVSVNNHLTSGYGFVANIFTTPTLPEGFAMAKVPTFRDRTSTAFASSVSSVSSFVASLLFVSPKNSASSAAVKNNKAETTEVETTETGTATIETEANEAETNSESAVEPVAAPATLLYAQGTTRFDFDGDGKADASRWQSSTGDWKVRNSSSGSFSTVSLGTATVAAPADYDGDGKTDHATFTDWSGTWKIRKSSTNQTETIVYGGSGDRVVSGDYDGDGIADIAIYRPSNGTWYVRKSTNLQTVSSAFGASTDVPVPGNYDGDGKMDYAVFRPSNGTWYVLYSSTGTSGYFSWGAGSDTPVPADYDGDNKTDFAVYRPSSGTWYAYSSLANNGSYISKIWGNYGDQPVPANYDGDGKDDFAVWRPKTGVWHIVKSSDPNLNTYEYHQVGVSGDVAVPSAYLKQIGSLVVPYHLANARLAPKNATGGTNLYSQNFGWGKTLVSLPGRAGLDAGFGISYNSLVWTKEPASNTMVFDADSANVSPGFRFGFPTIEPSYYNALTQKFSYMMVTPSGGRVEFRQDAASGLYETADSTYAQLKVNAPLMSGGGHQQTSSTETVTLTVTTTDGTMMDYSWKAGAYRLNQIKDRNGNFITIVYDDQYGLLQSVTDTLGRVINVNYDAEFYPTTITQQWKSGNGDGSLVPRTYAAFSYGYTPVNPTFDPNANLTVYGPSGNTNVKVLTQITYLDGTSTTFNYNSFGQVHKVRNVAADSSAHVLNSIRTNLETPGAAEPDCPRFTKTYNFIENFNGGAETLIHNTLTAGGTLSAGGEYIGPADVVEVRMEPTQAPHDVRSKTYYYGTGNWAEGLPFGTEDVVSGVQKRWTRTFWTQDDTSKNYKINPRVTESKVGDASNTKRTTVDYHLKSGSTTASLFGLVREVKVYDTNLTTVLKRAVTD
ncbi:MAG TPA: VCBS repeat-containing protein, partial [Pyrinomonadaceae bacterium]|nr:VCBS repeat-containing protein [Pyrinomonadaceae bacterium]